jgi:putative ABC transport system permease protein
MPLGIFLHAALRNVLRSPRRSIVIVLTIAWGVFFLGVFHAFNTGLLNSVKENTIHARYGHGQINTAGYLANVYERPWEHWIDDYQPLRRELAQAGIAGEVFPRVTFAALLTNDKTNLAAVGQGIDAAAEAKFFNLLNVEEGKTLEGEEKGVLLGAGLAKSLGRKVGDPVTVLTNTLEGSLNGVDLTVTGIFHTGSPDLDESLFRMQLTTAQSLLATDKVETVSIGLANERDWPRVADVVKRDFPALEATPFNVVDKVNYQQFVDWLKSQFGVIEIIVLTLVLLGILNNVATGVLERKQEIGCLKANGDTTLDVLGMITFESLLLGIAGTLLGAALVVFLVHGALRNGFTMPPTPGLTRPSHMVLAIQPAKLLETCVAPLVVTLLAAVMAGMRVARMPIAEALRAS